MNSSAPEIDLKDVTGIGLRERLSCYAELAKPRIAMMLVLTAAAGFYLGDPGTFSTFTFLHSMLGISLLAFGVAALNQFIERDTDGLMERTASRPLPTKKLTPKEAFFFGLVLCVGAEVYLALLVNAVTAILGLVVIIGYVLMYTPLKLKTTASTAIGAIPGAMPPVMGWTSANDGMSGVPGAAILFLILFLWQFPHFLAIANMYRDEYAKAGIKMLPAVEIDGRITARQIVVFSIFLIPISMAPAFFQITGFIYPIVAAILGGWFLYTSFRTARTRSNSDSRKLLLVSVIYLPLLFLAMVLNKV